MLYVYQGRYVRVGLAVLCGLILGGTVQAQVVGPAAMVRLKKAAARQQQALAVAPIAAELHAVKVLLERADRDYQGHRAAAVKEISAALRILVPRQKHKGGKPAGGGEPQALSDAQLRDAVAALGKVSSQLASLSLPRAAKANGHVGTAIKDLQVALTIK
jgi:hypothetical protein